MKKSMIIVGLVLILSMSFISAGLFDNWFGRISGKVVDGDCGSDSSTLRTSCRNILDYCSSKAGQDGVYWINPLGNEAVEVYCDMTYEGGGWTLVFNNVGDNPDVWSTLTRTFWVSQSSSTQDISKNSWVALNKWNAILDSADGGGSVRMKFTRSDTGQVYVHGKTKNNKFKFNSDFTDNQFSLSQEDVLIIEDNQDYSDRIKEFFIHQLGDSTSFHTSDGCNRIGFNYGLCGDGGFYQAWAQPGSGYSYPCYDSNTKLACFYNNDPAPTKLQIWLGGDPTIVKEEIPSCTDLCPVENSKECSQKFNGYNSCMDINSDGCLELKPTNCDDLSEECKNGLCVEKEQVIQCTDECTPKNSKRCNPQGGFEICLDTDNDGCSDEWVSYPCGVEEECIGGECIKKGCVAETKEITCEGLECGIKENNCGAEIACGNQCVDSICNEGICSSIDNCRGCEYKKTCVSYGFRTSDLEINLGASSYCNVEGIFIGQKQDEQSCQNNYECLSNQCSDGVCVGLVKEIRAQTSLLWRILCTMFNPISDTDKQACFDKHSVIVED